jgi:hypothetical protein
MLKSVVVTEELARLRILSIESVAVQALTLIITKDLRPLVLFQIVALLLERRTNRTVRVDISTRAVHSAKSVLQVKFGLIRGLVIMPICG